MKTKQDKIFLNNFLSEIELNQIELRESFIIKTNTGCQFIFRYNKAIHQYNKDRFIINKKKDIVEALPDDKANIFIWYEHLKKHITKNYKEIWS